MTTCNFPEPLTEMQLMAALVGEADSAIHYHLEICSHCRQELESLRRIERRLRRSVHPATMQLTDYHFGFLSREEHEAIHAHVRVCRRCQLELQQLKAFLELPDDMEVEHTSSELADKPRRPNNTLPDFKHSRLNWNQFVISPPVRSASETRTRGENKPPNAPLHFNAEAEGVQLALMWDATNRQLTGHLLPEVEGSTSWEGAYVVIYQGDYLYGTGRVDDVGQFVCMLPEGIRHLTLQIATPAGRQVTLEGLSIAPDQS